MEWEKIAKENLMNYWNSYQRDKEEIDYEIGDRVYYYNNKPGVNKLSTRWDTLGTIVDKGYQSYKLQDDVGKIIIANKKHVLKC